MVSPGAADVTVHHISLRCFYFLVAALFGIKRSSLLVYLFRMIAMLYFVGSFQLTDHRWLDSCHVVIG